jgi:Flp pilus assembly protein TadG
MLRSFLSDKAGNYAITMAVLTIPLLLSMGIGVDYSRYISARSHLQELADGTSLTLAASRETDQKKLQAIAEDFVSSNVGLSKFDSVQVADLKSEDDKIDVALKSRINTYFMGLANIHTLDVNASALAERAVIGSVEVALVLDNTDSMNLDNKIGTLKVAASDLVKKLHENEAADVRIALVPYGEQVNVGTANRKASWLSIPDDYSSSVTTTKEGYWNQPTKKKVPNNCLAWKEAGSQQVEKDGVWVTQTWLRSCSQWEMVNDGPLKWVAPTTTTTTTTYKWNGCVGSRVVSSKLVLNDGSPLVKYPGFLDKNGVQKCLTEIVPLTKDEATIQKAVTGMITSRSGYVPQTFIPGGLMWGINVLSMTEPYDQALDYDDENIEPRKVIVLMTDGLNTRRVNVTGTLNVDYLKGGALIGDTNSANAAQRIATNTDTTTLCTYAKGKKVEIFTVAFRVDDAAAKTMLQGCATDSTHYYDATDSDKLLAAFSGIAQSLSQVRLAR